MQALVRGRRVLVTGAGGTIGGELARQIASFDPAGLTLVDSSEYALYSIDLELGEKWPEVARAAILADVRDRGRVARLFADETPELVFHAAALKHVPMVEAFPAEGVLTNISGTRIVADCCLEAKVLAMVLISTDKAVNPTSVMGATKRIAETYCQGLDIAAHQSDSAGATRFITVRFGNVLGSTGSVVPLFQRQLAASPASSHQRGRDAQARVDEPWPCWLCPIALPFGTTSSANDKRATYTIPRCRRRDSASSKITVARPWETQAFRPSSQATNTPGRRVGACLQLRPSKRPWKSAWRVA